MVEQADFIDDLRTEDARNQMTAAAFTGWLSGAGGKKSFQEYWRAIGLAEKTEPMTKEQKKMVADTAKKRAADIIRKDRKRKKKKAK